jgi:hypothetical protein
MALAFLAMIMGKLKIRKSGRANGKRKGRKAEAAIAERKAVACER